MSIKIDDYNTFIISQFTPDIIGAVPDSIGNILSPLVKIIVVIILLFIIVNMFNKMKARKREDIQKSNTIIINVMIMTVFYALASLFSTFDILFGWKSLLGNDHAYLGNSISLLLAAIGFSYYYWFYLEIFVNQPNMRIIRRKRLMIFSVIQISSSAIALIFRIIDNKLFLLFYGIQMIETLYLFFSMERAADTLLKKIKDQNEEDEYKNRIFHIKRSSIFGIIALILFIIDGFSVYVTVYSLIGWTCMMGTSYSLYKAYV